MRDLLVTEAYIFATAAAIIKEARSPASIYYASTTFRAFHDIQSLQRRRHSFVPVRVGISGSQLVLIRLRPSTDQ